MRRRAPLRGPGRGRLRSAKKEVAKGENQVLLPNFQARRAALAAGEGEDLSLDGSLPEGHQGKTEEILIGKVSRSGQDPVEHAVGEHESPFRFRREVTITNDRLGFS